MTPTEIEDMVKMVVKLTPGISQAAVVKHMTGLFPVTAAQVTKQIKLSYPVRPYKQSNGRIKLWLLKPGRDNGHYGTPTGLANKRTF